MDELQVTGKQERIVSFLAQGYTNSQVAAAVGVTDSYITQLLSNEDFAGLVINAKMAVLQAKVDLDSQYDEMEKMAADKLKLALTMTFKPMEILRMTTELNKLKRSGGNSNDPARSAPTVFVQLNLPAHVKQNFVMNERSEVVEVAGRSLAPANAKDLMATLNGGTEKSQVTSTAFTQHRVPPPFVNKERSNDTQQLPNNPGVPTNA